MMNSVMLCASAHHTVARRNIVKVKINGGFLPMVSEILPKRGWKAVEVRRNAVESHDALFEELK